ncbi:MAG: glycosyltransferase family A protein [Chloroflexota bacterium]|nr:glycosyltransferase family A protein [Chloroflexota bacterium]
MPTISVIIPTYNRADYILEAIDSVLAQTYSDYEIIVVDDGSTDDTAAVLQPLVDDGVIRYVYQHNQGESAARNHGIRLARGQYIAFLDSDDLFLSPKLERQTAFLDAHPNVAFVHSGYSKFDDAGNDLGYRDTSKISGRVYPDILLDWSVLMAVPCVMVRAQVLEQVGGFDESLRWGPDLDLWRRITQRYYIGVIPESLSKVRVHPGNVSGDKVAAVASFERYLGKAFADDPSLDEDFQRRAYARLYSNVSHNLLADGRPEQMPLVRKYSLKAIQHYPRQWSAYLGWLGSFLPSGFRDWLLGLWRRFRYRN